MQKYPSIAKFYEITYIRDEEDPNKMKRVEWNIKDFAAIDDNLWPNFVPNGKPSPQWQIEKSNWMIS